MGETDKFVLRWNDFEKNIVSAYKDLRTDKDFFDCSLVSSGRTFQAHRVILSACSPVFRDMIRQCTHPHPVVYLRGVLPEDLTSLLDFMYHGQASVAEAELERFMEVAEELQVRGLTLATEAGEAGAEERRVSGGDLELDTAVDDDVNSLLAGLDTDQPPAKRVKQELGRASSSRGLSITAPSGAEPGAAAALQERIRVKQETGRAPPPGITVTRPAPKPAPAPTSLPSSDILASLNISASVVTTSTPAPPGVSAAAPPPAYPRPAVAPPAPAPAPAHPPVLHIPEAGAGRGLALPGPVYSPAPAAASRPGPGAAGASGLVSPHLHQLQQHQQLQQLQQLQHHQQQQQLQPHHQLQLQQQQLQQHQQQQLQQQQQQPMQQMGVAEESEQRQIEDYIGKAATGSKLECKECKKSFSAKSKASLIAHIESSHLRSSITCEVCTKQFKATSYLKQHQKRGACATPQ